MTGGELRELRLKMGLKPKQLAEMIRISRNSLYRLERGHRQISETIAVLVSLLANAYHLKT